MSSEMDDDDDVQPPLPFLVTLCSMTSFNLGIKLLKIEEDEEEGVRSIEVGFSI